jgi:heme-degrading monooxygenase HmoA
LFEPAYGPIGDWAQLLGKDSGYLGVRLLRQVTARVYVTIDEWESRAFAF